MKRVKEKDMKELYAVLDFLSIPNISYHTTPIGDNYILISNFTLVYQSPKVNFKYDELDMNYSMGISCQHFVKEVSEVKLRTKKDLKLMKELLLDVAEELGLIREKYNKKIN